MKKNILILLTLTLLLVGACSDDSPTSAATTEDNFPDISGYPIVGTNQTVSYNNQIVITTPSSGNSFYGQNANYPGTSPSYTNNGDSTITDNILD
jgi:hypothetical protein